MGKASRQSELPQLPQLAAMVNSWFTRLPKEIQDAVAELAAERVYAPGETLYIRGEMSAGIYCCRTGYVKTSSTSIEGRETILDFFGPGVWFGEVNTLSGVDMPRSFDAVAVETSSIVFLSAASIEILINRYASFRREILRLEAMRFALLLSAVEQYSVDSLERRLANRLLILAQSFGVETPDGLAIKLHLSQEVMAALIGASRQLVNRVLRSWTLADEISHRYGQIIIKDLDRFRAVAGVI
jgi:CRP-like cAMP-binding protein